MEHGDKIENQHLAPLSVIFVCFCFVSAANARAAAPLRPCVLHSTFAQFSSFHGHYIALLKQANVIAKQRCVNANECIRNSVQHGRRMGNERWATYSYCWYIWAKRAFSVISQKRKKIVSRWPAQCVHRAAKPLLPRLAASQCPCMRSCAYNKYRQRATEEKLINVFSCAREPQLIKLYAISRLWR